jgi:hypothetical protein
METPMHGSFDRSGKADNGNWSIGFLAVPAAIAVVLVALAMVYPTASNWISDSVQAEFVGADPAPAAAAVQVEQPKAIRTVKAN